MPPYQYRNFHCGDKMILWSTMGFLIPVRRYLYTEPGPEFPREFQDSTWPSVIPLRPTVIGQPSSFLRSVVYHLDIFQLRMSLNRRWKHNTTKQEHWNGNVDILMKFLSLAYWKLSVQPVMKISSKSQHFRFNEPLEQAATSNTFLYKIDVFW